MARPKVKVHREAVHQLLNGPEVTGDLQRRGQNIANAAGPGHEVQTFHGKNRVRITVRTATHAARLAEARTRALTAALGAGRQ